MRRALGLIEPVAMFAAIMAYIWRLRFSLSWSWAPLLGVVILSHIVRGERVSQLGFRLKNLGQSFRRFGAALFSILLALFTLGFLFGTFRPLTAGQAGASLALYLPWGLFQQYLLNAYFLRRFETALAPLAAAILTATLFAAVHSPNWFLMLVTLTATFAAVPIYRRFGNLYFLGFAHATIGFLLFLVVPDSISHHLNVGPGWWLHH